MASIILECDKYCDGCQYLKNFESTSFNNYRCTKADCHIPEKGRFLVSAFQHVPTHITKPKWCPLAKDSSIPATTKTSITTLDKKEMWSKIPYRVKWTDVKLNEILYLPPIAKGQKLKKLQITGIFDKQIRAKILNKSKSNVSDIIIIDKDDLEFHSLVRKKVLNSLFPKN